MSLEGTFNEVSLHRGLLAGPLPQDSRGQLCNSPGIQSVLTCSSSESIRGQSYPALNLQLSRLPDYETVVYPPPSQEIQAFLHDLYTGDREAEGPSHLRDSSICSDYEQRALQVTRIFFVI